MGRAKKAGQVSQMYFLLGYTVRKWATNNLMPVF